MNPVLQYLALYLIDRGVSLVHNKTIIRTRYELNDHWYRYCIMLHQNDLVIDSLLAHKDDNTHPHYIPLAHPTAFEQVYQHISIPPKVV